MDSHFSAMRGFKGRIPVYFRGDSTLLDSLARWRSALRRIVLGTVYRFVDVAIGVGSNNRDYFRWCGIDAANIEFAPHSVDAARFADRDEEREAEAQRWRARLGIPSDAIVFVFAGKFIAKKDPLLLIDAFLKVPPGPHLVLFGSGALEQQLRARAAGHSRIHVLPFQNQTEMPGAYRLGDVFVLPSRGPGETWGLTMNEAMACGRPVIASSKVGGARDLILPGVTGWQFPAGDATALSAILNSVVQLPLRELRGMGIEARQHIQAWSTEECVHRTIEIVARRTRVGGLRSPAMADPDVLSLPVDR